MSKIKDNLPSDYIDMLYDPEFEASRHIANHQCIVHGDHLLALKTDLAYLVERTKYYDEPLKLEHIEDALMQLEFIMLGAINGGL